jgi:mRNA interferase MazF
VNNFDLWNEQKQTIHNGEKNRYVKEGDIWWCALGINIGNEQNGGQNGFERPILVIRKFSNQTCLIALLTTKTCSHPFRIKINNINDHQNLVILSQLKTIDTKRLKNKIHKLSSREFNKIKKAIRELI